MMTDNPLSPLVQATPTLLSPFLTSSHDPAPHFISLIRVAPVQFVPEVRKIRERKCERPSLFSRVLEKGGFHSGGRACAGLMMMVSSVASRGKGRMMRV